MYTSTGRMLTSVYVEAVVDAASLCCETGCICEAHRFAESIAASVCVVREDGDAPFRVLAPCGICQERLGFFGPEVRVGVPDAASIAGWRSVSLAMLRPYPVG